MMVPKDRGLPPTRHLTATLIIAKTQAKTDIFLCTPHSMDLDWDVKQRMWWGDTDTKVSQPVLHPAVPSSKSSSRH
jgi:hypothetical protein